MLPPLTLEELTRILKVMHEMHAAAIDANWQELSRLDSERRAVLKYDPAAELLPNTVQNVTEFPTAKTSHVAIDDGNEKLPYEIAKISAVIQSLDTQIIATVQAARKKLLIENRELSAQVNAKNVYAMTSSIS